MLKSRQTVCQRQVDVLKAALGATQHGIEFNNRVPQPLNHRVVRLNGELEEKTDPPPALLIGSDGGSRVNTNSTESPHQH